MNPHNDDEDGPAPAEVTPHTFATKHEEVNPKIEMPKVLEVGETERMELVGYIMSLVDSVVIVQSTKQGKEQVLDTDSLLVFDDRKVLGHVRLIISPNLLRFLKYS